MKIPVRRCKLPQCRAEFQITHGSQQYCSKYCWKKMKTVARKLKFDSTKHFVLMLAKNDAILRDLYAKNHLTIDANSLYSLGFDFSISRNFNDKTNPEVKIFDCGEYYIKNNINYGNYKILKHE